MLRHFDDDFSNFVTVATCRHCRNLLSLLPLCSHCRHFSSPSPLCRHQTYFLVVITFVMFPLPFCVAFASTLIYHSSHNLATSITPAAHRRQEFNVFTFLVATLSSLSPLCRHCRHFWVVITFSLSPCSVELLLLPR